MKIISTFLILLATQPAFTYYGEIRALGSKDKTILFNLEMDEKIVGGEKRITALFRSDQNVALEQLAVINKDTAELISSTIQQFQTKEKSTCEVIGEKVKLTYEIAGQDVQKKELKKPKHLVGSGNFADWLTVNFETLQKEKSMLVDFLVWEKSETYPFKVTYLGEVDLGTVKAHSFKMNIDNFLLATFISPIRIWKSKDMKLMLKYEGRIAVKQAKGLDLKILDAEVLYFHDLKAAQ